MRSGGSYLKDKDGTVKLATKPTVDHPKGNRPRPEEERLAGEAPAKERAAPDAKKGKE